jgi:pimeloyl-ACP methyl ester carboxylesterase
VATAHNHTLKVTGHCRATEGIKNALRAGYDCVEHATFIDDEGLDLLLERDVPVVPGLQFEKASVEHGPAFGLSRRVIAGHQETLDGGAESCRRILAAGGRLGMGGDYGFGWNPHGDYAKELTFFVRDVGLDPLVVLSCATKTGAEIMGRGHEIGTLAPGKLADILVVDGDVVADISVLEDRRNMVAVMHAARLVRDEIGEPVVILGHSLGAMVAAGVAAALPALVRGVVLEDPPFHSMGRRIAGTAWEAQFTGMRAAASAGGTVEELAAALADIELPLPDGRTIKLGEVRDAAAIRWSAACLATLDPEVLAPVIAGHWLDGYDPESIARRIRCPCVLLQADAAAGGALAEDEARAFVAAAGNCEVERFPGSGHQLHWHHPDRVVAAVERLRNKVAA